MAIPGYDGDGMVAVKIKSIILNFYAEMFLLRGWQL
jgi:hypothetical protein